MRSRPRASARECGRNLLILDSHGGASPDAFCERLGRVGVIPGYALLPQGLVGSTVSYCALGA